MDKNSDEYLEALRHTASHILAQAVKRLYPETKLCIGPAIEDGFYYDFFRQEPFSPQDIENITFEMEKIVRDNLTVERIDCDRKKAAELLKDEPFKMELLNEIKGEKISFYRQGEFIDMCAGPHASSTGEVKYFKLLNVSAAYWRGDEKRESLQRIYGVCFPEKEQLDLYLKNLEEAKKRDHRILGQALGLFSLQPDFGPGLVYWHPNGATIRKVIEDFWRDAHFERGYHLLYTPHIASISLWEKSGHLSFYRENMFPSMNFEQGFPYQLKPMNCPFHILIYQSTLHSYKEFPIRWAELGTVYRYEKDGVLHGVLRVRGFTQDDAHIFCRPDQIENEVTELLDFVMYFLSSFGFSEYEIYLSTRPDRFVGTVENWEKATKALENALIKKSLSYQIDPGEGVFYGPKIDIKIKDCLKRTWQCSTIQVDFNIPERFGLKYVNQENQFERPIMIHRAIMGSLERFFGILIEHYSGNFPVWLAPVQVKILTVADRFIPYAEKVLGFCRKNKIRADLDGSSESLGKKIRTAENEKIPILAVIGEKEQLTETLAVRLHKKGMKGAVSVGDFVRKIKEIEETKSIEIDF
ncbi:MAG: threonine--tRNA ligase [Candidatus Omnitrophica bacterium]|nr:threonine--tRNA ligase [Candidatus Omnitrophota bacterium]MCM8828864.1 threonine--tRNA ligase [Candidatus Omnitrophota bacterium]